MDDYENTTTVGIKRTFRRSTIYTETNNVEEAAVSGRKVNTLVFILFGVLCMTQATLNIVLRLCHSQDRYVGPMYENIREERDDLQQKYWRLQTSHQTLSEQRDELERRLHSINSFSKRGWLFKNGSFYLSDAPPLSWMDSREYCLERGADLIIINSAEEQEFVKSLSKPMWIGLTDGAQERAWRWVDGSLLTMSFWYPNEPNNSDGEEDCVEVKHPTAGNNWNDLPCNTLRSFICEKAIYV